MIQLSSFFLLKSVTAPRYAFFQRCESGSLVNSNMRKIVLFIVIASLIMPSLPLAHAFAPAFPGLTPAPSTHNALIISSLDEFSPMRQQDVASFTNSLTQAGYAVTYLKDGAVTLNFLTTQLNNYEVIIWRTDAYEQAHTTYWYIGQQDSQGIEQAYTSDLASGSLDSSHGIVGAGVEFFSNHFTTNTLPNVKLMIIVSSMSAFIASSFLNSGVKAIIDFSGVINLQFNWVDYLTTIVVEYLADGLSVSDAIDATYSPFLTMILHDPLDTMYIPPVSYAGDSALKIV